MTENRPSPSGFQAFLLDFFTTSERFCTSQVLNLNLGGVRAAKKPIKLSSLLATDEIV
jgi:hypothetical protein